MSPLALVAGLTLVTITSELRGRVTLTIFTLTAVSLFTCSAIYHRVPWSPAAKAVWRRWLIGLRFDRSWWSSLFSGRNHLCALEAQLLH